MILWLMLIIYTALHLFFWSASMIDLVSLFNMNVDPLIFMMFNLLGVFPFAFLLFTIKHQVEMKMKHKVGLALGFVSGAFSLYPTLSYLDYTKDVKKTNITKYGSIVSIVLTIILLLYGILLGNITTYIYYFLSDSLVQIMTIDFVFLYVLSIHLAYKKSKKWYLVFIPLLGFLYTIYE